MRAFWLSLILTIGLLAAPAFALVPPASDAAAEDASVDQTINAEVEPGADQQIADRIRGFFGALDGLSEISVEVEQGVVTLSGILATQEDIDEAERLAGQVEGVVAVQNRIERDLSVGQNLGALSSISDKFAEFVKFLPLLAAALLVALVIGVLGYIIAGFAAFWRKVTPNVFLAELVASAIRFVFVVGGIVIALEMIGAGALLGAVLGGAGVIGIALGFAMRDTIENYVASLMLSLRQPFRANDHVLIGDLEGRVIRLTSRATVLMTLDGNHLRVPNSTVFKAVIVNYTRNPQRRFDFELGVDAEDDPTAARRLGVKILKGLDFVLGDPEPTARVEQVGDSNIVIRYLGWIDQREADWHKARSRAIHAVKDALEAEGFALPEPIYRLRFDSSAPLNLQGDASISAASGDTGKTDPGPVKDKPAKKASTLAQSEDVSPDNQVGHMVEAERAAEPDENDLLDSSRPVE
ncbi:mechanosensitive ion channel family protein [Pontixanthobacter aestiaquae]|nr:mechanosensitive ion channel family protein [Pontixanthobacter aestiaquae]MDN3647122.1 mechanosensitive ion channel family protein [Pontixanthobacter aestiaquae]